MKKNRTEKNNSGKKRPVIKALVWAAGLCCCALLLVFAFRSLSAAAKTAADNAQSNKTYGDRKAAGMVNGEPFFQEDLDVYAAEWRAAVAAHFGRLYKLNGMGAAFWDTKYGKSTPREFMTDLALKDLIRNMVMIQEARRRGIDAPQSYHDLEEERAAWNAPTDEITYGPKQLGPAEFNSYRLTGISDELKTLLLKKELAPTTAQMRAAYQTLPDAVKIAPNFASGIRFFWEAGEQNAEINAAIEQALRRGSSPEEIAAGLSAVYPGLSSEDFEFDSRYISKEDENEQEWANRLAQAAQGACIPGPEGKPELYYVTKKEGGGILTFEQAPLLGRNKWINDQFEHFLDKKAKAARITIFKKTS